VPRCAQLHVEVLNDEIIVILPATSYGVVYYKPANSRQLLAKNFLSKNDRGAPITQAEFLARAWQAANAKARELGWIV
jgi:predicted alpha/beta hydrolase family esterase